MTVELPVKPRVLNETLPLPGEGLAVNPVAFCVTASITLCCPRSAMVWEETISTLAGVCSRDRLRRLPVEAGAPRLMVGAAPKPAVDVPRGTGDDGCWAFCGALGLGCVAGVARRAGGRRGFFVSTVICGSALGFRLSGAPWAPA